MDGLTKYATLVVPIGTAACLAYLFGYWAPLGVNFLEHIGLSDVVRMALYPMVLSLSFLILGMIGGTIIGPRLPTGGARAHTFRKSIRGGSWIFWAIWTGVVLAGLYWGKEPSKWVGIAMLLGVLAAPIAGSEAITSLIPGHVARTTAVIVILLLPSSAFAFGRVNAYKILSGSADRAIDASRVDSALGLRATPQRPIMYAGRLGDRIVLYETLSKQVVLVREDSMPVLPIREK